MRRVLVIGSGGAGKSTLARRTGAATGLPVVHLDRLYWRPGWAKPPPEEWAEIVAAAVSEDRWILDGNYGGTLASRLAAADTAIFLDLPRSTCLRRAVVRALRHRGRARDDMAPGCPDRLTWQFARWIWDYPRTRRPGILSLLARFEAGGGSVVVLHDDREVNAFVSSLEAGAPGKVQSARAS